MSQPPEIDRSVEPRLIEFGAQGGVVVFDGFFANPHELRGLALEQRFEPVAETLFPGERVEVPFDHRHIIDHLSAFVDWDLSTSASECHFNIFTLKDADRSPSQRVPHVDTIKRRVLVALTYLNLPDQCRGGTGFYIHLPSGSDRVGPTCPETLIADLYDPPKPTDWECIRTIEMRFNRVVVYGGNLFHSATVSDKDFGAAPEARRLTMSLVMESEITL